LRGLYVQAPPLDEDVLRIVAEVNKKRKGGRDEDSMGEILFKISENFHKFKQVRPNLTNFFQYRYRTGTYPFVPEPKL
jgi:hypothetical protein